ncbi:hypothetical protein [Sporocytophaga myxococcoides]|uniref:hypothetical protein n=1 Tax=Sporocytophaga myxococcoides TaxID=153721 RepID=UPI00048AF422|nr:hypothetical protein [Sporocytophaga myxococcoides]
MKTKTKIMMALKIWVVIYPSITIFLLMLGEQISTFPLYIRTFILTITLVPWMVFAGLPLLDKGIQHLKGFSSK